MSDLEQAARLALDVLEDLVSTLDDDRAFMTSALSAITALRAALAQQAEPVAIPGAIPMSKVVARSRAMPERADALERARERLVQAEPVDKALTKTEPPVDKEQAEPVAMEHLKQYGYAPGDYMRTCIHCKVISIMDKRSSICLGCARQLHAAALEQTEPVVEPDDASGNPSY